MLATKKIKFDKTLTIYCHICHADKVCNLKLGAELFPKLKNIAKRKYWRCSSCGGNVGCRQGTSKPIGPIVSAKIKRYRSTIHLLLRSFEDEKLFSNKVEFENKISKLLGNPLIISQIITKDEARSVYQQLQSLKLALLFGEESSK
ncbi:DUF3268 family zinc-finger domain-containing protein (plasmid) [Vibrio sp. SS-MA-C1-2]|uniref:DUF3268 family zinc-finger domain-containing protein n=1 Tax=Vibrio sp. SS-MA-C1-2 TaxID=2908646 RepID=UPI001F2B350A|nr:DUF3268 family zinc-finger domain-containing protein [Vibrio sp. SS-MA-C1-2]UJF20240.1 DUF3268 family zinc-finger domain-containing protein [Vibrio sp. SS-MA-C1-2]